MSKKPFIPGIVGKIVTCTRCGTQIFLERMSQSEREVAEYEDLPEEWLYEPEFGCLCPACADMFKDAMHRLLGDKNPDKWKPIWALPPAEKEEE